MKSRSPAAACLVVLALGSVGGVAGVLEVREASRDARATVATGPPRPAESTVLPASTGALQSPRPQLHAGHEAADPIAVRIPRIGVSAQIDHIGITPSGELARPPRWQAAAWYADGPAPGQQGPAVVAGHVDSPEGPAVFARLGELRPGDIVKIDGGDGTTVTFTVDFTMQVSQDSFPTEQVYGPTPDSQLRLITCAGDYDREAGRYRENLVVFATVASA